MIWLNNSDKTEKSPVKSCFSQVQAVGELQGLGVPLGVARQGPAAGACPTAQPGAGSWGPGAAPAPASGTSLGPGRRPAVGPASAGTVAGPGRAVGSWRVALLRCRWARGWRPQGLVWGPGPWEALGARAGTVRAGGASGAWRCQRDK